MAIAKKLILNADWCKGCGICAAFCPKQALEIVGEKVRLKEDGGCILCGQCELRCPDYAIYLETTEEETDFASGEKFEADSPDNAMYMEHTVEGGDAS